MPFRDFTYPAVVGALGLTLSQTDLFPAVPPADVSADLADRVADGVELASNIDTEKAKSEFIVAPILQDLRRRYRGEFALFSGVPLDVDAGRGLNGVCDFLLARSPIQSVPTAPLAAIVEAKNDNPRSGLGQCVASMVAVWEFNQRAGTAVPAVYGASTSGVLWRFARLVGTDLTIDDLEYPITDLRKIFGILAGIVRRPG